MATSKQKGDKGEDLACEWLKKHTFEIVERNFKSMYGEVDIICIQLQQIIFVEVKRWTTYKFEDLEYSINRNKQRRIIQTSLCYLAEHSEYDDFTVRYDVFFLARTLKDSYYIENAFEGNGNPL